MLTDHYRKGIFRITERIGKEPNEEKKLDVKTDILWKMKLLLSPEKVFEVINPKKTLSLLEPNYLIDLSQTEEEIFSKISRSTRRNIKKAVGSDDFIYVELTSPTDNDIEEFSIMYDQFADKKNIDRCNVRKLKAFRNKSALVITYIKNGLGQKLCYQTYFCDGLQAYGMYSVLREIDEGNSLSGQIIGRANKYLDWRNIQRSKERGCTWYNFGGKVMNHDDPEGQNVNNYKLSFGAITGYDLRTYYPLSFKGRLFINLLKLKLRWQKNEEFLYAQKFLNANPKKLKKTRIAMYQKELP